MAKGKNNKKILRGEVCSTCRYLIRPYGCSLRTIKESDPKSRKNISMRTCPQWTQGDSIGIY